MNELKTRIDHSQLALAPAPQKFVTEHNQCAMCDSELEIHHEINLSELRVKEEAHCPSCGIRVRVCHFDLH